MQQLHLRSAARASASGRFRAAARAVLGLLGAASVVLALGAPAAAQLDLPKKKDAQGERGETERPRPGPQRGNLVPHLACTVCGTRNYTTPIEAGAPGGLQSAWCATCRQASLHRRSGGGRGKGGGLDLPSGAPPVRGEPVEGPAAASEPAAVPGEQGAGAGTGSGAPSRAAMYILDQVRRRKDWDDRLVLRAADSLVALEDEGRRAARAVLFEDDPTIVMTALRVLARSGRPEDLDLVVTRLTRRLPARAAGAIVQAFVAGVPVRATPRMMLVLLDHDQSGVRAAAWRHLPGTLKPEHLPDLARALESERSETRERVLGLLAGIDDPAVLDLLLAHVDDARASVARRAVEAVAAFDDPRVEYELLARAFAERWVLRSSAYALLAILRREELRLEPILGVEHAEPLLGGLSSSDAFVAGTCAAALAGIGFRAERPSETPWLDQAVVDRLVYAVSGRDFHNDFSSLVGPATRRLELLTGQSFGTDGPRWVQWWLDARGGFWAHRAWIEVAPEDVERIVLRFRDGGDAAASFALVGPRAAEELAGSAASGERFVLSAAECRDVALLLGREGVLGPERLPGRRGARTGAQRSLEVVVGGGGKRFDFGPTVSEPWFERLVSAVRALHERNRWQRYPVRGEHADSLALWRAEHAWWDEATDERERARRLQALVLASLESRPAPEREGGIRELERLYADPRNVDPADFHRFLALLRDEPFASGRARSLALLALRAAGGPPIDGAPSPRAENSAENSAVDGAEDGAEVHAAALDGSLREGALAAVSPSDAGPRLELVRDLLELLDARFRTQGADLCATVLLRSGPAVVRAIADEESALLRAVAATTIGATPEPAAASEAAADEAVLLALFADPDAGVRAAAALALGRRGVESARADLVVQARVGESPVREAALEAVGLLGGEYVFDALVLGLADRDPRVKLAAVRGLADLGDAKAAPLFVSMLAQGPESTLYEPARAGLVRLGAAAHGDLLRVAQSSAHRSRREAALILAEELLPEVAPVLLSILTEQPSDAHVARELAILTCADFRTQSDPAGAWWAWWDTVVHDDPLAWYRAALERRGVPPPAASAFADPTRRREVAGFLLDVLRRTVPVEREAHVAERTRRELAKLLGRDVPALPAGATAREAWLGGLSELLEREWRD